MEEMLLLLSITIFLLMGVPFLPSRIIKWLPGSQGARVTYLVGFEFLIASASIITFAMSGDSAINWTLANWSNGVGISLLYDGISSLMLLLVSFIGLVVSRFSIQYVSGEEFEDRYFSYLGFTIGAVSFLVVAGNLLFFVLSWVMTSYGLHQLLTHYSDRPAAQRAAWTKFAISRIGDSLLIIALVLVYQTFGTFELLEVFSRIESAAAASTDAASSCAVIAWLLMLGAVTKSAQFPFHTWLPETMETPTPVSALMHAGIVNAGGYLVIRMSPLIVTTPSAMIVLGLVGAFTACFASVVMITQPSIKRMLAYSTIAQMGFMMLQCGLGAFSAAMLHLLAHSLYKAHAFLSSGSVISESLSLKETRPNTAVRRGTLISVLAAAVITVLAYFVVTTSTGLHITEKPGGLILAFILYLAFTTWGWRLFSIRSSKTAVVGTIGLTGLCVAYCAFYLGIDHWLGSTITPVISPSMSVLFSIACILGFSFLFGLHAVTRQIQSPSWLNSLRVHASNGFYVDQLYRRVFTSIN